MLISRGQYTLVLSILEPNYSHLLSGSLCDLKESAEEQTSFVKFRRKSDLNVDSAPINF